MFLNSKAPVSRLVLSLLISTQMTLAPLLAHAETTGSPHGSPSQVAQTTHGEVDPIWQQFVEADASDFKVSFSHQDPSLDQDPYFLHAQSWTLENQVAPDLAFFKAEDELRISIPHLEKSLKLNLPLTPIQATDEFIFFSLDDSSKLFEVAAGKGNKTGEGIFFISRSELVQQALDNKAVPIFFFPLAGQGWTGKLDSLALPQIDSLVVANNSESVVLELKDVETVMKAQQINLLMATSLSARNRSGLDQSLYPAAGMTAAFGLFFTGIDLELPEKSMWPQTQKTSFFHQYPVLMTTLKKLVSLVPFWSINQAQAFELSPDIASRLVFVGSVLTGMLAASVVIKYAQPGVRQKVIALRGEKKVKGPLGLIAREIKETFDVFAAVTTTSAQVATVTFANSLELFLDRFAPTVAAADHTLIRRALKNSYYFSRNSVRNVPVNAKTFFLGALVMGTVDTAMVVIQYVAAVPWIANSLAPHLSESLRNRIERTFDPNNPNTKEIAAQDSVRNGLAYLQIGASSYSMEAKQQVIDIVTREVESSMKSKGLNPDEPQNQALKQKQIDEKVNITMKQKGLPGKEYFLFDASTIFNTIPKVLGYRTPEDLQTEESFILANRFGLSKNALNKALGVAKEWARSDGSQTSMDAVSILQETSNSMSFLKNGLQNGIKGVKVARQVRQQLTLLSYEGSVEYAVKFIPETWSAKYTPEAAQAASLLFRQALYSYLAKEGDNLLMAKKTDVEKFGQQAKFSVLTQLRQEHPELSKLSDREIAKSDKHSFEFKLRTQLTINDLVRAQATEEEAHKFELPKQDWLAQWQHRRALQTASEKMQVYLAHTSADSLSEEALFKQKQSYFTKALAQQIGLQVESSVLAAEQGRADYVKMIEVVEETAETRTQEEIEKNPNMVRLFEKSTPEEQAKTKMFLYANNYFQAYKELSTELEMVGPTDPAQPGKFQKIRQTQIVRSSAFLTRVVRVFESLGDDQNMKLGWSGAMARNVPLFQDLVHSHKRLMKVFLPALTVSYAWTYYAWQVHVPFAGLFLLVATSAATISTPSQWLNRSFRMQGIKAMGGIASKIAYTLPYAWVTFLGMFPVMMYSPDVAAIFSDYVRDPFMSAFGQVPAKVWLEVAAAGGLTAAVVKTTLRPDFKEKLSAINSILEQNTTSPMNSCARAFLAN